LSAAIYLSSCAVEKALSMSGVSAALIKLSLIEVTNGLGDADSRLGSQIQMAPLAD
jgi:hypothetical protein